MNYNFFTKLFKKPQVKKYEVTIDSKHPELAAPIVTVLTLDSDWAKNEWNEGWADGQMDFKSGKPMCPNLNYPVAPYARGYMEAWRSLRK